MAMLIETQNNRRAIRRMFRHGNALVGVPEVRTVTGFLNGTELTRAVGNGSVDSKPVLNEPLVKPDPLGTVTLGMYDAKDTTKIAPLVRHYVGGPTLDAFTLLVDKKHKARFEASEARRKKRVLRSQPALSSEVYDKRRQMELAELQDRLKQRVNSNVYGVVQEGLGLPTLDAAANIFEAQRKYTNSAVKKHASLIYPGIVGAQLRNEADLRRRPGDLLQTALTLRTDPVLRYELQRQAADTVISLQQERGFSVAADFKLTKIQNLFNAKLYTDGIGSTVPLSVYGVFANGTNSLQNDEPFYHKPQVPAKEGTHYKELPLPVRTLENGLQILTLIDTKDRSSSILKAKKKAALRAKKGKGDTVHVAEDVQDTHRMKLVVLRDQATAKEFANQVFDLITDVGNFPYFWNKDTIGRVIMKNGLPTGAPTGRGNIRIGNRGDEGQSTDVNYTKIEVEFDGVTNPVEIVVQDVGSYLQESLEVGVYNENTGRYSGPAHELYDIHRGLLTNGFIFPKAIYPDLPHPYEESMEQPHPPLETKARDLRQRHILHIPVDVK
ncbi:MAG: hypothetical protein ACREHC_06355 [Candidatus Levyibacteriota bacterium]